MFFANFRSNFFLSSSKDPQNHFLDFYIRLILCRVSCGFVLLPEATFLPDKTHDIIVHPQRCITRSSDLGWYAIIHGFLKFCFEHYPGTISYNI